MDDTLYQSEKFKEIYDYAVYSSVSEKSHLSLDTAQEYFENKRTEVYQSTGLFPGKTQTLFLYYGVSIDYLEQKKLEAIQKMGMPILNSPEQSLRLKKAILSLSSRYWSVILTNNHKSITNRVLEQIGLEDVFDRIYTLNDMPEELSARVKAPDLPADKTDEKVLSYIKPSLSRLQSILEDYQIEPQNCMSIGDRYYIDHVYAEHLGMRIFLVNSVEDVITACRLLSDE